MDPTSNAVRRKTERPRRRCERFPASALALHTLSFARRRFAGGGFCSIEADPRVSSVAVRRLPRFSAAAERVSGLRLKRFPLLPLRRVTVRIRANRLCVQRNCARHDIRAVFRDHNSWILSSLMVYFPRVKLAVSHPIVVWNAKVATKQSALSTSVMAPQPAQAHEDTVCCDAERRNTLLFQRFSCVTGGKRSSTLPGDRRTQSEHSQPYAGR